MTQMSSHASSIPLKSTRISIWSRVIEQVQHRNKCVRSVREPGGFLWSQRSESLTRFVFDTASCVYLSECLRGPWKAYDLRIINDISNGSKLFAWPWIWFRKVFVSSSEWLVITNDYFTRRTICIIHVLTGEASNLDRALELETTLSEATVKCDISLNSVQGEIFIRSRTTKSLYWDRFDRKHEFSSIIHYPTAMNDFYSDYKSGLFDNSFRQAILGSPVEQQNLVGLWISSDPWIRIHGWDR